MLELGIAIMILGITLVVVRIGARFIVWRSNMEYLRDKAERERVKCVREEYGQVFGDSKELR